MGDSGAVSEEQNLTPQMCLRRRMAACDSGCSFPSCSHRGLFRAVTTSPNLFDFFTEPSWTYPRLPTPSRASRTQTASSTSS